MLLMRTSKDLLSDYWHEFRNLCKLICDQADVEFSCRARGTNFENELSNETGEDTNAFRVADNDHFCVALTMHAFSENVFSLTANPNDFYS